jgi:hypothetical protein
MYNEGLSYPQFGSKKSKKVAIHILKTVSSLEEKISTPSLTRHKGPPHKAIIIIHIQSKRKNLKQYKKLLLLDWLKICLG